MGNYSAIYPLPRNTQGQMRALFEGSSIHLVGEIVLLNDLGFVHYEVTYEFISAGSSPFLLSSAGPSLIFASYANLNTPGKEARQIELESYSYPSALEALLQIDHLWMQHRSQFSVQIESNRSPAVGSYFYQIERVKMLSASQIVIESSSMLMELTSGCFHLLNHWKVKLWLTCD
ncbi:unnamed protein product [Citrullus colocynthis]|uniref:Uncharacterized protein n=1 Tax=Citrullus colocynthis TaxID=252529 RepID=A0ABP0YC27_9ROSI